MRTRSAPAPRAHRFALNATCFSQIPGHFPLATEPHRRTGGDGSATATAFDATCGVYDSSSPKGFVGPELNGVSRTLISICFLYA